MDQLYLIEILVSKVKFGHSINPVPKRCDIKLNFQCGDILNLDVQPDELCKMYGENYDKYRLDVEVNSGKSYLFISKAQLLVNLLENAPLKIALEDCAPTNSNIIGEITAPWPKECIDMVYASRINVINLHPKSYQDVYKIVKEEDDGQAETLAEIEACVRISCYGIGIETKFQVVQREAIASSEAVPKRFLFRSSNADTTFQARRFGEEGSVTDALPVGPIYHFADPKTWNPPKELSPDDLTAETLEKVLCHNPHCPGAQKFKQFGIGPAATGAGLGTVYGKAEVPISYGLSHTYGNLDNYGPYGFYSRPKQLNEPFVPKEQPVTSEHTEERSCSTEFDNSACECKAPLRLTGGAPIEDENKMPEPMTMCKDLLHSFDQVLSSYRKALGPCGQVFCPFTPNIMAESCRRACTHTLEEAILQNPTQLAVANTPLPDNNKLSACGTPGCPFNRQLELPTERQFQSKQIKSACGSPGCPYAKQKAGIATDEEVTEMHLMDGPKTARVCGNEKCPVSLAPPLPELEPIHWECPDPLPKGPCRNPQCPLKPKELRYDLIPRGPCGSTKCPYATPAYCGDPTCSFAPPQPCPYSDPSRCPPPAPCPFSTSSCTPTPCPFSFAPCPHTTSACPPTPCLSLPATCPYTSVCPPPSCPPSPCPFASPGCPPTPCPFTTPNPFPINEPCICENTNCPANPPTCGDPTCPYNPEPFPCPRGQCLLSPNAICGVPDCPYAPKSVPTCTIPDCPYATPVRPPPCEVPSCPFNIPSYPARPQIIANRQSVCSNPNCEFATTEISTQAQSVCNQQNCPFSSKNSSTAKNLPPEMCNNTDCPFINQAQLPCTLEVGGTKITLECTYDNKDADAGEKNEDIQGAGKTEHIIDYRDSEADTKPCDPEACQTTGGKLECSECGRGDVDPQTANIKRLSQSAPAIPDTSKVHVPTTSVSDKVIPPDAKKKKNRKCKYFVYKLGDLYPGVNIGHRECIIPGRNVPAKMGWLWNVHVPCVGLKPRLGWRPGAIGNSVARRIREHRKAKGLKVLEPLTPKSAKKSRAKYSEYESDSDATVAPKPTLAIKKREGCYYITMNPLKDPKTLEDNENPYMDCTPMQFKITKNKDIKTKYDENGECVCGLDEDDDDEKCLSSSSSELDIEFTPPAGVIRPERLKKKKGVVHIETQYAQEDFLPKVDKPKTKAKKDKKGKKGKGKKGKKGKK